MAKKLPVGIDDFKKIREEDFYYIDKSLFIKDIIDEGAQVILLPRPRRFGKTLNLSMLRYYFEKSAADYSDLFSGLQIEETGKDYLAQQGKYPVIDITFKDIKEENWPKAKLKLKKMIAREYKRHRYLLESDQLDKHDKEFFNKILSLEANIAFYEEALKDLSDYLAAYHNEKVIILIDEYDQPIQSAYTNNFYDKMINFMRNFLSGGLKNNSALEKGVLTGILRVAKESIFSGLNNLVVSTLLDQEYSKYFGLLEEEVEEIFAYYGLDYEIEEIKDWYNGYNFGSQTIYNPWSIINCIRKNGEAAPYWANTSSNDLIRDLIIEGGSELKTDLELLIKGGTVNKKIDENIVFGDIDKKSNLIWSFLLLSGYLRANSQERKGGRLYCDLDIPNQEVRYIYEDIILDWFEGSISSQKVKLMLNSLITGDVETFAAIFKDFVLNSMSNFDPTGDEAEKVYHAFVLGLLLNLRDDYQVKSNRESGYGRYDVMIIPEDTAKLGIVIEFKKVNQYTNETLEEAVEKALEQIKEREYKQELISKGVAEVLELGIAFSGKQVLVKSQ
ncbi:AAA family ATPase [Halanaerobaculum tunisiense]